MKLSEKTFLIIVIHLRAEANSALIWAICVGIIKSNCIWAKVNERACKILLATASWFPHQRQLGTVLKQGHEASAEYTCVDHRELTRAHAGLPILTGVSTGTLRACL